MPENLPPGAEHIPVTKVQPGDLLLGFKHAIETVETQPYRGMVVLVDTEGGRHPFWAEVSLWRLYRGAQAQGEKKDCCDLVCDEPDCDVVTERGKDYGHPRDNFRRIADLWNGYGVRIDGELVEAHHVAALNRLQKEARLKETPGHADSLLDLKGYARTQEMLFEGAS